MSTFSAHSDHDYDEVLVPESEPPKSAPTLHRLETLIAIPTALAWMIVLAYYGYIKSDTCHENRLSNYILAAFWTSTVYLAGFLCYVWFVVKVDSRKNKHLFNTLDMVFEMVFMLGLIATVLVGWIIVVKLTNEEGCGQLYRLAWVYATFVSVGLGLEIIAAGLMCCFAGNGEKELKGNRQQEQQQQQQP